MHGAPSLDEIRIRISAKREVKDAISKLDHEQQLLVLAELLVEKENETSSGNADALDAKSPGIKGSSQLQGGNRIQTKTEVLLAAYAKDPKTDDGALALAIYGEDTKDSRRKAHALRCGQISNKRLIELSSGGYAPTSASPQSIEISTSGKGEWVRSWIMSRNEGTEFKTRDVYGEDFGDSDKASAQKALIKECDLGTLERIGQRGRFKIVRRRG